MGTHARRAISLASGNSARRVSKRSPPPRCMRLVAARAVRQMTARAADSTGRACNLAAAGDLAELRLLSTDALRELDAHGSQG